MKIRFVKMSLTRLVAKVCMRILVAGTEKHCRFDKYIIGGLNGNLKLTELEVKKEAWKSWENMFVVGLRTNQSICQREGRRQTGLRNKQLLIKMLSIRFLGYIYRHIHSCMCVYIWLID